MAEKKSSIINIWKFHACVNAKKQWKKRSSDARVVYDMIVVIWTELYEWNHFHPKMTHKSLPPRQFETIIHNIGWIVADEITRQAKEYNKQNPENPVTTKVLKKKCTK